MDPFVYTDGGQPSPNV